MAWRTVPLILGCTIYEKSTKKVNTDGLAATCAAILRLKVNVHSKTRHTTKPLEDYRSYLIIHYKDTNWKIQ